MASNLRKWSVEGLVGDCYYYYFESVSVGAYSGNPIDNLLV